MKNIIDFTVRNPVVTLVIALVAIGWGWSAWNQKTVDAIPDISQNQVIVDTSWSGRSPEDVEDQVTYPLATQLAGVKGVKEIRGLSGFGFSRIYVVFHEPIRLFTAGSVEDFYEARTRVLEKLSSLEAGLPEGVVPELGPDATALGQVFMYTVDGPYDLATLRSLQDFVVRYELQAVEGVAEVASVGGMVRQYQVEVDPLELQHHGIALENVRQAIRLANLDVGAKTVDEAGAEYLVRGLGFIRSLEDLERTPLGYLTGSGFVPVSSMGPMAMEGGARMISVEGGEAGSTPLQQTGSRVLRPVLLRDVATVRLGPEFRRGTLVDGTGERAGGIVTMRFGANPREVTSRVRKVVDRLNDPKDAMLPEGVHVVPFYDRTQLIDETVETLETALVHELWITVVVVLVFLLHLRSAVIVAGSLPIAVIASFVLMDLFGVDSNIMSLTGIAIAIGTMVDMAIVMTENIFAHLEQDGDRRPRSEVVIAAAREVGPALLTAAATTIISFVPIFFLTDMEGKLFRPLAWTKTFALGTAALSGVLLVPVLCLIFLGRGRKEGSPPLTRRQRLLRTGGALGACVLAGLLAAESGFLGLRAFTAFLLGAAFTGLLVTLMRRERLRPIDENAVSRGILRVYEPTLRWILAHKALFLLIPTLILVAGLLVGVGGDVILWPAESVLGEGVRDLRAASWLEETFPGLGQEFMPPLDEGSLLYMPSLLPQASLSQSLEVMRRQNHLMEQVPEVAKVMGKLGRADTALDPAPVGMFETVVILKPRDLWRPGMFKRDLVNELMALTHTPGVLEGAGAWIQPIETRVIMLNSDIRAPLAVRLTGTPRDEEGQALSTREGVLKLEEVATRIRDLVKQVPGAAGPNVENLGGKLYAEYAIDREAAGRYGVTVQDIQDAITTAVGGMVVARSLEGRDRYTIQVAYQRELRDRLDDLDRVQVRGGAGLEVPLSEVARMHLVPGPAAIKTTDGRLRLHVTFAASGRDEVSVMEDVLARIERWREDERTAGRSDPVPLGVGVAPAGRYESQQRARERFQLLIPICLGIILFLLYLKFRSWFMCVNVLLAVPVCVAGGLLMLAVFPDIKDTMYALGLWDAPSTGPIYITVAVIVGFIALAGIATDDGVVIGTYLEQSFARRRPQSVQEIREATVQAGLRRIRPCLMTTFTTIIALYPILASTGRGSDVAQPMALPAVGGMLAELVSLFVVPCVYCLAKELGWRRDTRDTGAS